MRSTRVGGWDLAECGWDLAELWMRSSRVVRASDSQCRSRNCPCGIWVLNIVHNRKNHKKSPFKKISLRMRSTGAPRRRLGLGHLWGQLPLQPHPGRHCLQLRSHARAHRQVSGNRAWLKGQCHEIFAFRLFYESVAPKAHEYSIRVASIIFENSRSYSQLKVYNCCKWKKSSTRKVLHIFLKHLCV